jgi:hypothetical protein
VSTQLESRHFYHTGDVVEHLNGSLGTVVEGFALWAVIRWEDGRQEEVDQLDPAIGVLERAVKG